MIEFVPGPNGLRCVIGIVAADVFHVTQVDDDVAGHGGLRRGPSAVQAMTIRWPFGKNCEVVMRADHGDIALSAGGSGERGVELRGGHLPDDVSAQIHFLHYRVVAVPLSPMRN